MDEEMMMADAMQNCVLCVADADTPEGKEIAERYGVALFPTFILINADDEIVARWIGFSDTEEWGAICRSMTADPVTIVERKARFESSPAMMDAIILGRYARGLGESRESEKWFRTAIELNHDAALAADAPMLLFRTVYNGVREEQYSIDEAEKIFIDLIRSGDLDAADVLEMTTKVVRAAGKLGETKTEDFLREAGPHLDGYDGPNLYGWYEDYLVVHALYVEKNAEEAVRLRKETLEEGWETDANGLNAFAWWCFENRINLEEAEEFARKGVDLSKSDGNRANVLDTLAEIVNVRGNPEEALRLIKEAIHSDPESEYLREQEEKFNRLIEES